MKRSSWVFFILIFIFIIYSLISEKDQKNEFKGNILDESFKDNLTSLPKSENLDFPLSLDNETLNNQEIYDYYPHIKELHWGHMPLKYYILNPEICGNKVVNQIIQSFDSIENETEKFIHFERVYEKEDISIECFDRYDQNVSNLAAGNTYADSGVDYVFDDGIENVASHGKIRLFKVTRGNYYGRCGNGYPVTIIHEILHLFGFEDSYKGSSIMYRYVGLCLEEIDEEIIIQLKENYKK